MVVTIFKICQIITPNLGWFLNLPLGTSKNIKLPATEFTFSFFGECSNKKMSRVKKFFSITFNYKFDCPPTVASSIQFHWDFIMYATLHIQYCWFHCINVLKLLSSYKNSLPWCAILHSPNTYTNHAPRARKYRHSQIM